MSSHPSLAHSFTFFPQMITLPIDINAIAGSRWQLNYEQPYRARDKDPWQAIIPCQLGHIYKHSDELLGVATNTRTIGLRLAKLPGIQVTQEADDGFNLVFAPKLLPKVAAIVKPKRKRRMSAEQRALAVDRLAKYRAKSQVQRRLLSAGTLQTGQDVSLAV